MTTIPNPKTIKLLNKLFLSGYKTEKELLSMSVDQILAIHNISIAEMVLLNELQKAIKANRVISFLSETESS